MKPDRRPCTSAPAETLLPFPLGVQSFQSLAPIQNQLQAGALILMIVPVIVLIISQRYFMRDMVVTGMEK